MSRLNKFPFTPIKDYLAYWGPRRSKSRNRKSQEEYLEKLKSYETELMERLLLVRSEINDVEQYLAVGQD